MFDFTVPQCWGAQSQSPYRRDDKILYGDAWNFEMAPKWEICASPP